MADEGAHESSPSSSSTPDGGSGHGRGRSRGRGRGRGEVISEYERQRLARIQENRARLEALNLPGLSSSLFVESSPSSSSSKRRRPVREKVETRKNKKGAGGSREGNGDEDDDDYQPSDEGNDEDEEEEEGKDGDQSSSYEEEEWATDKKRSSEYRTKGKKKASSKGLKVMKDDRERKTRFSCDFDDNDNTDLQQAIALSLGGLTEGSTTASKGIPSSSGTKVVDSGPSRKNDKGKMQKAAETGKKHNVVKSRVQLTEDEVIAYFFSFDEVGKGYITIRDLEKMAITHDFNWTENEIFSMIHSFDSDGDGKLSLEDFQTIVRRCNMLQVLEEH